jgi:uncharacterized protein (UPF0333 family)
MNNKGQITAEYMLLVGVIIIILITTINMSITQQEKNTIQASAQIGAQNGIDKNGYAMYYNDTFNNYQDNYPKLLTSTHIKIIQIKMIEKDNKTIELQAYAHSDMTLTVQEKNHIGSRINYYIRRSITETFNKEKQNEYYSPAESDNYIIKTRTVIWK